MSRLGRIYTNKYGESFQYVCTDGDRKATVKFLDDGSTQEVWQSAIDRCTVTKYDRNYYMKQRKIGEKYLQKCGLYAEIVDYENSRKKDGVTVRFSDGFTRKCGYGNLIKGDVAHPDHRVVGKHTFKGNQRQGEERKQKCGLNAKIMRYEGAMDISVLLSDGTFLNKVSYKQFQDGTLSPMTEYHSSRRKVHQLGDKIIQSNGMEAELIERTGGKGEARRCKIRLDNGEEFEVSYHAWRKGMIVATKDYTRRVDVKNIIGKTYHQHCGLEATIVSGRKTKDVDVIFEDGTPLNNVMWNTLKNGEVCHPIVRPTSKDIDFMNYHLIRKAYIDDDWNVYYICKKLGSETEELLSIQEIVENSKNAN